MAELHFPALHSLYSRTRIPQASRLKVLSKLGSTVFQMQDSFEGVVAGSVFRFSTAMEKNRRDDPGMRARLEKNCLRSSSTSGVHRDKKGLPNPKVQTPNWNTSARVHDSTAEFPQILARGPEKKRRVRRIRLHHHHPQEVLSVSQCCRLAFRATVLSQVQLNTHESHPAHQ